jgi:hypothetical protein
MSGMRREGSSFRPRLLPAKWGWCNAVAARRASDGAATDLSILVIEARRQAGYWEGMKSNTKSSITLPPTELALVEELQARLGARSKVEVVRRGLRLLKEATDRESLRSAYRAASASTRGMLSAELEDLDLLVAEGLDES